MRLTSALLLTFVPATFALAQTAPVKKAVATHHTTTVHSTRPAAAEEALPPNIPKVAGIAKPLFALRYIDTLVGTGALAEPTVLGTSRETTKVEFYTVKYTGWLAKDGTKFDSSNDHPGGEPITFPYGVHRVIPGWDTGFEGMHIGGKRRLFVPWQLAYGESGRMPAIPPKADLIFDVELVGASDKPPTPPAPPTPPTPPPTSSSPDTAKPDAPATPPPPPANPESK